MLVVVRVDVGVVCICSNAEPLWLSVGSGAASGFHEVGVEGRTVFSDEKTFRSVDAVFVGFVYRDECPCECVDLGHDVVFAARGVVFILLSGGEFVAIDLCEVSVAAYRCCDCFSDICLIGMNVDESVNCVITVANVTPYFR